MVNVTSMNPEAVERISNGLGIVTRERRLPSRAIRLERVLGFANIPQPTMFESDDVNEFHEEDMWGDDLQDLTTFAVKEKIERSPEALRSFDGSKCWVRVGKDPGLSVAFGETKPGRGLTTSTRLIPKNRTALMDYSRLHMAPQSAPVEVPDWSKILRKDEKQKERCKHAEYDEDEDEKLPPHEFLSRQYARSGVTASVLEGAGRTLKGRDLSRVRNAVWRQTGFDE